MGQGRHVGQTCVTGWGVAGQGIIRSVWCGSGQGRALSGRKGQSRVRWGRAGQGRAWQGGAGQACVAGWGSR